MSGNFDKNSDSERDAQLVENLTKLFQREEQNNNVTVEHIVGDNGNFEKSLNLENLDSLKNVSFENSSENEENSQNESQDSENNSKYETINKLFALSSIS